MSLDSFAPIDKNMIDVVFPMHDGYPEAFEAEDTRENLMQAAGDSSREFPEEWWVEPRDWAEFAREHDRTQSWPMNRIDRFTNQSPTHECTTHSLTRLAEAARNFQIGVKYAGPKRDERYDESAQFGSVWFSALSVYIEANPGQWGGAGIRQVLEIACRRGFLPDKIQPRDYGFEHSLHGTAGKGNTNQSSGPWVKLSRLPEGWQRTAALFKPQEVVFPESFEQAVCCVLHRGVGVGRKGHAIPWMQLIFEGNNLKAAAYPDSYDVIRYDSVQLMKSAWRGCFSIATMTAPNDWNDPAKG